MIDGWLNQLWNIHTMGFYAAVKRNRTTDICKNCNLMSIMLNGKTYCVILLTQHCVDDNAIEIENRVVAARGLGVMGRRVLCMTFQGQHEEVLCGGIVEYLDCGGRYTNLYKR